MKELVTTSKYKKFKHKNGSRYEFAEFLDCGRFVKYKEIDKEGFCSWHEVHIDDIQEWDELCKKYPQ